MRIVLIDKISHLVSYNCSAKTLCGTAIPKGYSIFTASIREIVNICKKCAKKVLTIK